MNSLSDKAGFLIVANLIKYAVGFVLPMVLVRMLSQSDYGTYQQLLLIHTFVFTVMCMGLPYSVYYFYHHLPLQRLPTLIAQTSLLLGVFAIVSGAAVVIFAAPLAASFNNPGMAGNLRLYILSTAFLTASEQSVHFMIAQNRYKLAVVTETVETVVRVLLVLTPLWLGFGFYGLMIGIVTYAALRFAIREFYLFASAGMRFKGWWKGHFIAEQLGYGVPIALGGMTNLVGNLINRWILAAAFNPSYYAIYAVGALEIPLDAIFQQSVANVLRASLPPLVRDNKLEEVARITCEAVRKLSIIVMPSFIFLYGFAFEFITTLFTHRYSESVTVFRIYLWLMPLNMMVLSPIPQIFGKTRLNLYIIIVSTAALLALGYPLLKAVGLYGPALAVAISQWLGSLMYFVAVQRLTHARIGQLLPLGHLLRVILASLAGLLAARLFGTHTASGLLNLLLLGIVFSIVFFAVALPIGVFTAGDLRLMRRWLAKLVPVAAP